MNKQQQFWDWFIKNSSTYFLLNQVADECEKERLLNNLLEHLHSYSEGLYFEIGGSIHEAQELIISADGKKEYFDDVERLVAEAPLVPNWKFIAFKQPSDTLIEAVYEGIKLTPRRMWFLPMEKENDVHAFGLTVYLENYEETNRNLFLEGVFKVLDTLLGEKEASNIQYVDVERLPQNPEENGLIELVELPKYILWRNKPLSL